MISQLFSSTLSSEREEVFLLLRHGMRCDLCVLLDLRLVKDLIFFGMTRSHGRTLKMRDKVRQREWNLPELNRKTPRTEVTFTIVIHFNDQATAH